MSSPRLALLLLTSCALPAVGLSQNKPGKIERREMAEAAGIDPAGGKPGKVDRREMKADGNPAAGGKPSASADAEARMLSKLREFFEVTDDAEWEVLATRIAKVGELRRGSAAGSRVASLSVDGNKRNRASGNPDLEALRAAVKDKMPDAEIKARLSRMHQLHLQSEARIAKAQEELRAVLTVRQEAVAVMAGLLPP